MQRKTKGVLVGAGFLTLLGLGWRASRAKAAPPEVPPEGVAAGIGIAIYDMEGNLVPVNSPATLTAGFSYIARITVINTSKQSGVLVAATLIMGVVVTIAGIKVLDPGGYTYNYVANEGVVFDRTFPVAAGYAGATGTVTGSVFSPVLALLATAVEPLTIVAAPIVYGATITVGVPV